MTPAAVSWRAVELWPAALALGALAVAALGLLYGPALRAVAPAWRVALMVLRGLAMAALAASVLRPVMVRITSTQEQGIVAVLLDTSMSMGVRDRAFEGAEGGEQAAELVSLADALGRLPPGARSTAGADQVRQIALLAEDVLRARRGLDFARLSGRHTAEAQSRLDRAIDEFVAAARAAEQALAGAAPQAVVEHLSRLAKRPRADELARWLDRLPAAVARADEDAQRIQSAIDAEVYAGDEITRRTCAELSQMSRLGLSWQVLAVGSESLLAKLGVEVPVRLFAFAEDLRALPLPRGGEAARMPVSADGRASDIAGAIAQTVERLAAEGRGRQAAPGAQAVVVFSDGRQVGGSSASPAGVPVFAVYAAAAHVRDLSVAEVETPQAVFVNESVPLRLRLAATGMEPAKAAGNIEISVGGGVPTTQPLVLRGRARQHVLDVRTAKVTQPGPQRITVAVPVQSGELETGNNRAQRWVKVLSQRLRVALICGAPTWDYRSLRSALLESPWVELVERPADAALPPQTIAAQDLVILVEAGWSMLTPAQWDAVRELVGRRGGSLIVLAGDDLSRPPPPDHVLAGMLPVETGARMTWHAWPGQKPAWHAMPAPQAENLEVLRLDDDAAASRQRWEDLGAFYRYLTMGPLKPGARTLLVERDSLSPLLVEGRVGSGRVMLLGLSEVWRWRGRGDDAAEKRLWTQLVRYAMDEPYALTSGAVSFDVDRIVCEPGRPVRVRARVLRTNEDDVLPESLEVTVCHNGEPVRTALLVASSEAGPGRYSAAITSLPPGEYELRLGAPGGVWAPENLSLPLIIERSAEAEMADLSGDRDNLARIAEASGGKCLRLEQVRELPRLLMENLRRHPRVVEMPLWDSAYLMVFVVGCLTVEWTLRKRLGLA